jgi:alkylation response protein AidB-like acyl-CoA dehydrogenase
MDFNDTPEEAGFRAKAKAWLAANAPSHAMPHGTALDDSEVVQRAKAWQRVVYDGGYAGITLPKALGGQGGSIIEAVVYAEEEARFPLPKGPYIGIGLGMAVAVIGKHGTDVQRAQFISSPNPQPDQTLPICAPRR